MKKKLRRCESFFGMHFDFHASTDNDSIGANTTAESIQKIIDETGPDYIQTDCKGHPGYASYPTSLGNAAPGVKADALKIWRDVTDRNGVGLYVHYSGVWDTFAIKRNPSYARIDENGIPDKNNTSLYTRAYLDEVLIPQMKELALKYGIDGAWIDGDCWASCQDYCEASIAKFRETYGDAEIPKKPEDELFYEFTELNREAFREHVRYYVKKIHSFAPEFDLCSNWAFTTQMPDPVSADVDYISGDVVPDSLWKGLFESRVINKQGLPWDLMAWGFGYKFGSGMNSIKSAVQLQQEAAGVISAGGGFQIYFQQKRDGSVKEYVLGVAKEVASFVRARQDFCHKAAPVPQVGLLLSSYDFYKKNRRNFSTWDGSNDAVIALFQCLSESGESVEVLLEHHEIEKYPVVVLPELKYMRDDFKNRLERYAANGGKLVIIGETGGHFFDFEMKERKSGAFLKHRGQICGAQIKSFEPVFSGGRTLGELIGVDDLNEKGSPAAYFTECGKGMKAFVAFNAGELCKSGQRPLLRKFFRDVVGELFPERLVKIKGSSRAVVSLMEKGGDLIVNLLNAGGDHSNPGAFTFDEIPPTGPVEVFIRETKPVKEIVRQPDGAIQEAVRRDGYLTVTVPEVGIHAALVVKY